MKKSNPKQMFDEYLVSIGATNADWKLHKHMLKHFISICDEDQSQATIEFDLFLESIGGLESAYRADVKIMSRYFFTIEDGWLPLVQKLIEDCIAAGWNKQVSQVKSKFGGLRFYISEHNDEVAKLISEAENRSYCICEKCGADGVLRITEQRWLFTACDDCASKRTYPYNDPNGKIVKSDIAKLDFLKGGATIIS